MNELNSAQRWMRLVNHTLYSFHHFILPGNNTWMKSNIGSTDKIVRMILAAIILALYFAEIVTGIFGIVLILLAVTLILTSLVGFSPLYMILGITTRKKKTD